MEGTRRSGDGGNGAVGGWEENGAVGVMLEKRMGR